MAGFSGTESDSPDGSFDEVARRGVWWEVGRRFELPECTPLVTSARFGQQVEQTFRVLLPAYDRIAGHPD